MDGHILCIKHCMISTACYGHTCDAAALPGCTCFTTAVPPSSACDAGPTNLDELTSRG